MSRCTAWCLGRPIDTRLTFFHSQSICPWTNPLDQTHELASWKPSAPLTCRECGLNIELDDIPVHSLVPEALRDSPSADAFMGDLPQYDGDMSAALEEAAAAGEVLRYVGERARIKGSLVETPRTQRGTPPSGLTRVLVLALVTQALPQSWATMLLRRPNQSSTCLQA